MLEVSDEGRRVGEPDRPLPFFHLDDDVPVPRVAVGPGILLQSQRRTCLCPVRLGLLLRFGDPLVLLIAQIFESLQPVGVLRTQVVVQDVVRQDHERVAAFLIGENGNTQAFLRNERDF